MKPRYQKLAVSKVNHCAMWRKGPFWNVSNSGKLNPVSVPLIPDLNPAIARGLRRREPSIDFRAAAGMIPDGTADPNVLRIDDIDRGGAP